MAKESMKPACEGDKSVRTNANPVPATMTLVMVCTIARTRLNTNLSSYIQMYSPPKSARVAFRSLLIKASMEACINSLEPNLPSAQTIQKTYALIMTTPSMASWYSVINGDPATAVNLLNSALTFPNTPDNQ
jgi:hypothetical protein